MYEFAPIWKNVKMTKKQIKKYIQEMEERRKKAQMELEKAKMTWEFYNEEDLKDLDKKIDDL